MTTRRLLWGMTWRGAAWGLLCGATLAPAYGIFFWLWNIITDPYHRIGNIRFGALFLILVPGIAGIVLGRPIGFGTGFVVALTTHLYFFWMSSMKQYRWLAILVSISIVGIGAFFWFFILGNWFGAVASAGSPFNGLGLENVVTLIIVPTLVEMICAGTAGYRLAHWYETEVQKQKLST